MPFFSVVIPTYNRATLLAEAIDSVLAQTFRDFEIVVVDDGSTDETPAVLERYARGHGVRMIRQENAGQATARNRGTQEAQGEYVAFLDSDDVWFPWTLQNIDRAIGETNKPAALATSSAMFGKPGQVLPTTPAEFRAANYRDILQFFAEAPPACIGAGFLVAKREELLRVGGFPATRNNSEDTDLCLRLGDAAGFTMLSSPPSFGQREHATNVSTRVDLSAKGLDEVISRERAGAYTGGRERRKQRWRLITFTTRAISVHAILEGHQRVGWHIYRQTFAWHVSLGRWKYLIGFPALSLRQLWRGRSK